MIIKRMHSLILMLGLSAASVAAQAQDAGLLHWHVMGGYSAPVGTTSDYLQGGYLVGGGFSITPSAQVPLDVRFDLNYSDYNATNNLINVGQQSTQAFVDGGDTSIWSATGNVQYRVPFMYGVQGYGIAGVGVYHARVALTQGGFNGGGYYDCDPFAGYCGDNVVAENSVTRFGWNAGLGVEFALPNRQSWFVEARYTRITTDEPIAYVPVTVGYKF